MPDNHFSHGCIVTDRLLLRPWEPTDADSLFRNANDSELAESAGWLPHSSPEYSLRIIKEVLMVPETYAIVPRDVRRAVGSISLKFGRDANISLVKGEAEIGYWIGRDYWNNGYVTEAARALISHGFDDLKLDRIWCLCRTENIGSKRVQDKCGFRFVRNGLIRDPIYGELEMRFTCIER